MTTQPDALRLAELLSDLIMDYDDCQEAAAELRRLHEVNKQLLEACHEATALFDNYPQCFEAIGTYQVLNQAIAKAQGEIK